MKKAEAGCAKLYHIRSQRIEGFTPSVVSPIGQNFKICMQQSIFIADFDLFNTNNPLDHVPNHVYDAYTPPPPPADPWDVEIPNSERLEQVYKAWMAADKKISVRKIAQKHGILPQTLNKRVNRGALELVRGVRRQTT